jgi:ABC-2 type transport system ATP-binding protein
LLADYIEHPRTVVLSTHLIDEVADLLERVVLIERGRIILDAAADEVRGSATRVSGAVAAVERFVAGRPTWDRRTIVSQTSVVLAAKLDEADRANARALRLSLEPVSLQQLIVHAGGGAADPATNESREGTLA